MTNNVRCTFRVGDTTHGGLHLVLRKTNKVGVTKYNIQCMEIQERAWKFKLGSLHGGHIIRGVVLRILIVWVHLVDDKELGIGHIGCHRNSPRVLSSSSTCMTYESPQLKQFPTNTSFPSMNLSGCWRWKQSVRTKPLQQSLVLARVCMWASTFLWSSKSPQTLLNTHARKTC